MGQKKTIIKNSPNATSPLNAKDQARADCLGRGVAASARALGVGGAVVLAGYTACLASQAELGGWGTSEGTADGPAVAEPLGIVLEEEVGALGLPDYTVEAEQEKVFGIDADWEAGIGSEERFRTFSLYASAGKPDSCRRGR